MRKDRRPKRTYPSYSSLIVIIYGVDQCMDLDELNRERKFTRHGSDCGFTVETEHTNGT